MKIQHEPYAGTQTCVFLIKNLVMYSLQTCQQRCCAASWEITLEGGPSALKHDNASYQAWWSGSESVLTQNRSKEAHRQSLWKCARGSEKSQRDVNLEIFLPCELKAFASLCPSGPTSDNLSTPSAYLQQIRTAWVCYRAPSLIGGPLVSHQLCSNAKSTTWCLMLHSVFVLFGFRRRI